MFNFIKRGLISCRSIGLKRTLFWLCFGYLKSNKFFLFRRDIDNSFPEITNKKDISIRMVSLKELKDLRKGNPNLPEEFFCDIFKNGKTCFVGFVGENIASIMWVFFQNDVSRFFNLKEREAEINYAFTLSEFRGLNLYPLTIKAICKWLDENKYKWLYGAIHDKNVNAIKAIGKCGFEKIGEIKHISFWRPKWENDL